MDSNVLPIEHTCGFAREAVHHPGKGRGTAGSSAGSAHWQHGINHRCSPLPVLLSAESAGRVFPLGAPRGIINVRSLPGGSDGLAIRLVLARGAARELGIQPQRKPFGQSSDKGKDTSLLFQKNLQC